MKKYLNYILVIGTVLFCLIMLSELLFMDNAPILPTLAITAIVVAIGKAFFEGYKE